MRRTARAVVVDASDSMGVPDATGVAPERAAAEAAAAELASATYGVRIDARDLRRGHGARIAVAGGEPTGAARDRRRLGLAARRT